MLGCQICLKRSLTGSGGLASLGVLEWIVLGQIGELGLSTVWQRCVATCDQIRVAQRMRDVSEFVACCHLGNRDRLTQGADSFFRVGTNARI